MYLLPKLYPWTDDTFSSWDLESHNYSPFFIRKNLDVELWDDMSDSDEDDETIPFEIFFEELKAEAKRNGMEEELSEEDARELYVMMQEEFLADDDDDDADEDYSSAIKVRQSSRRSNATFFCTLPEGERVAGETVCKD